MSTIFSAVVLKAGALTNGISLSALFVYTPPSLTLALFSAILWVEAQHDGLVGGLAVENNASQLPVSTKRLNTPDMVIDPLTT
jgi:hypothetical protein